MVAKKIVAIGSTAVLLSAAVMFLAAEKITTSLSKKEPAKQPQQITQNKPEIKESKPKYDLYSANIYDIPLTSIVDISELPKEVKNIIDTTLESAQGFYHLKYFKDENRVLIILQNAITNENTYTRHNLEIMEIFVEPSGKVIKTSYFPSYNGEPNEIASAIEIANTKNEAWSFDNSVEPLRPLKHTVYNERGKIKFTEQWNYNNDNPIKYIMKDSRKKVASILKETLEGDSTFRREHIFYDQEGNTLLSVGINYDEANITRFTYYDSLNNKNSINIISEYANGLKIKETIYNENYELLKTIVAEYQENNRSKLKILNPEGNLEKELN